MIVHFPSATGNALRRAGTLRIPLHALDSGRGNFMRKVPLGREKLSPRFHDGWPVNSPLSFTLDWGQSIHFAEVGRVCNNRRAAEFLFHD